MSSAASLGYGGPTNFNVEQTKKQKPMRSSFMGKLEHKSVRMVKGWRGRDGNTSTSKRVGVVKCRGLIDFIGGDLVKFDIGKWLSDVEEHKAIAIYPPHEGGYEGRYLSRLKRQGYYFLDLSARGLGDPETTLTKIHPVCPPHVGKQPIARWYFPPEVDYRLEALPPNAKGLVVWIIEAKVLSKAELQFLALLPTLRPNVRVIAECGNWLYIDADNSDKKGRKEI
ncbi:NAD(P)H-quinone oxidoreductase subunit N, chloroplastic [Mucuna pruriens]|uniref:NAD(P)H-quinone oxidoreductase subunit N, chloroplastic n=1 Tax=Mucuna pruriens TaxID=157652 RepID=A0A371I059_MUCPR|nr:NAD(P)H-quinone oxidoreductase subunit N, chloroplastic [Mucuna pruriens]